MMNAPEPIGRGKAAKVEVRYLNEIGMVSVACSSGGVLQALGRCPHSVRESALPEGYLGRVSVFCDDALPEIRKRIDR
jgi:hypothetical protein